jgi:hypothetical protein
MLSQNLIDSLPNEGLVPKCNFVPNSTLSEGVSHIEPGACWHYETWGSNSIIFIFSIPSYFGLGEASSYVLTGFCLLLMTSYLLYRIVEYSFNKTTGFISAILFLTSPYILVWGLGLTMFTLHIFSACLLIFLWQKFLPIGNYEPAELPVERNQTLRLYSFTLIILFLSPHMLAFSIVAIAIIMCSKDITKTKLIHSCLLSILPLLSFAINFIILDSIRSEGAWPILSGKLASRSVGGNYEFSSYFLTRTLDQIFLHYNPVIIGLSLVGLLFIFKKNDGEKSAPINLFLIFLFPAFLEVVIFQEAVHTHELFITTLAIAFSIPAAFAISRNLHPSEEKTALNPTQFSSLIVIILSSIICSHYILLEMNLEEDYETLVYIQENINEEELVVIENTLWFRPGYIPNLPDDAIHYWPTNPSMESIISLNPDEIITTDISNGDENFQILLLQSGYCQEIIQNDIIISFGTDFNSTISWKKC